MSATRTLSSLRGALPFVDVMGSFPSRSESVSTIRSLRFRLRWTARASSLSLSSAGMRRSTAPPSPGVFPARPLGSNGTAKRDARMPTATSLRLLPVRRTSSASRLLSSPGIRTRTSLRVGASTTVLALYHLRTSAHLRPDGPDPLADREPGGDGEQIDRPLERAPRREDEPRRDHDHAFGAGADPNVALEPQRFRAGAR